MEFPSSKPMKCFGNNTKPKAATSSTAIYGRIFETVASNDAENLIPDSLLSLSASSNLPNSDALGIAAKTKKRVPPTEVDTKISRVRHTLTTSKSKITSTKTTQSMRTVLGDGHLDDLQHLRAMIGNYQSGKGAYSLGFTLVVPPNWSGGARGRFKDWIEKLGFELQGQIYKYPNNEIDSLAGALNNVSMPHSSSVSPFESLSTPMQPGIKVRSHSHTNGEPPSFADFQGATRMRSQSASVLQTSSSSDTSESPRPTTAFMSNLTIDTSNPNFRRARFDNPSVLSSDSLSDSSSPFPGNITPSGRYGTDSRPGSTRSRSNTTTSPLPTPFINAVSENLNLAGRSRRCTKSLYNSQVLDRINSGSGESDDEKESKDELLTSNDCALTYSNSVAGGPHQRTLKENKELMPEQTSSFTFLPQEYEEMDHDDPLDNHILTAANIGVFVEELKKKGMSGPTSYGSTEREGTFTPASESSDTSTVLDESMDSMEEEHDRLSETRKNSVIVPPRSLLASIHKPSHSEGHSTPVLSPKVRVLDPTGEPLPGFPTLNPPSVDMAGSLTTPAFDRVPTIAAVAAEVESSADRMRAVFDRSRMANRPKNPSNMKESRGSSGLRRMRTDPGYVPDPLPVHCSNFHPPSLSQNAVHDGSMCTPQTKQISELPWLMSPQADLIEIEMLRKLLNFHLASARPDSYGGGIATIPESPAPVPIQRAVSVPTVPSRQSYGDRLSVGSNFCLYSNNAMLEPRESLGSCFDEQMNHFRLHHHNSDPSPIKAAPIEANMRNINISRRKSTARDDCEMMPLSPDPNNISGLLANCSAVMMENDEHSNTSAFFTQISSSMPGSLSISRSSTFTAMDTLGNSNFAQTNTYSAGKCGSERKLREDRAKRARMRRRSMASQAMPVDSDRKRQSMAFCMKKLDESAEVSISDPHILEPCYTTETFRKYAVVVGGKCTYSFDNLSPVIMASCGHEKYVADVRMDESRLQICLASGREHGGAPKQRQWVDLGEQWRYIHASPTGYLITKEVPSWMGNKVVFYFMSKFPTEWSAFGRGHMLESGSMNESSTHHMTLYDITTTSNNSSALPDGSDHGQHIARRHSLDIELDSAAYGAEAEDFRMSYDDEDMFRIDAIPEEQAIYDCSLVSEQEVLAMVHATSTHSTRSSLFTSSVVLSAVLQYLPSLNLTYFLAVSKQWTLSALLILSGRINKRIWQAIPETGPKRKEKIPGALDWAAYKSFLSDYPTGNYLSSGACKEVYCVRRHGGGLSAVSVMDIVELSERDMGDSIVQELDISLVCSALGNLHICPNMIRINTTFRAAYDSYKEIWKNESPHNAILSRLLAGSDAGFGLTSPYFGRAGLKFPKQPTLDAQGSWQYIHMEYCQGGDMESYLRKVAVADDLALLRSYMFQMCYALYSVRECFAMRHYDIKLLNFFLTSPDGLGDGVQGVVVGFADHLYNLPLYMRVQDNTTSPTAIVKLADFGTSLAGQEALGSPITVQQFTTIENSAPEMLLLGASTRQSFALDSFPLGLCFLHLLTGAAPYEELLQDVHCPLYLYQQLLDVYHTSDRESPYFIIREVVESLCEEEQLASTAEGVFRSACEDSEACPYGVIMDTLYRYLVLLSAHLQLGLVENELYRDNPVYTAIVHSLGLVDAPPTLRNARRVRMEDKRGREHCMKAFAEHAQRWSIVTGSDPVMIMMRKRLDLLGGAQLLESLLHLNPSSRCAMSDALQHPVFKAMRSSNADFSPNTTRYLHYYRPGHLHDLPLV